MRARVLIVAGVAALALLIAFTGPTLGRSGGAGAGTAKTGCTCHGTNPTTSVTLALDFDPPIAPGVTAREFNVTFTVDGPDAVPPPARQNEGGFALEVSAGTLEPLDGTTQLVESTITHTAAGNDQRAWTFRWTIPENVTGNPANFTFNFAGNAVNGDGLNSQLDAWKLGEETYGWQIPPPSSPSTSPTNESGVADETPSLGASLILSTGLAYLLIHAHRERRRE